MKSSFLNDNGGREERPWDEVVRLKSEGQDVQRLLRNFLDKILEFWILRLFV